MQIVIILILFTISEIFIDIVQYINILILLLFSLNIDILNYIILIKLYIKEYQ